MPKTPPSFANLPVTALPSVGTVLARQLAELGIYRMFDLVMHLPKDYEDRSRLVPIGQVGNGERCLVVGRVVGVSHRRGLLVRLSDGTGELNLKFFHTYPVLMTVMQVGQCLQVFGEIHINQYGVQLIHPEYRVIDSLATTDTAITTGLVPIYATTKNLQQNKIRHLIRLSLKTLSGDRQGEGLFALPRAYLPQLLQKQWTQPLPVQKPALQQPPLPVQSQTPSYYPHFDPSAQGNEWKDSLIDVLTRIHIPSPTSDVFEQTALLEGLKDRTHPACQRLIFEELVAHQLTFMQRRYAIASKKAPKCQQKSPLADKLKQSLPFALTDAQIRVVGEIVADLGQSKPMLRLVQGDVGAGKTLVAALSACYALDSGWQVALMAPTEILAEQHYHNFCRWFMPLGVNVGFLVGKQSAKQRGDMLAKIRDNSYGLVVGTHALFQEGVDFAKLGLVVIDEQHRFGVEQRLKLADKAVNGTIPHQLNMTATPIPRTLAMSLYGDMDVSIIDELPPNRTPITTVTINRNRRDEVIERITVNCQAGKQAYWICPLVEESAVLDAQSATLMYEELTERLPIAVGLVHGKMKPADKQAVMQSFKEGLIDLLIATTVVEVGVDVPNASLMVIENAERLGLSQLHQLRGRVGRGVAKSFCVLLYQSPLSEMSSARLAILKDSSDGFVIAEQDLILRGAGELLGTRQTGDMGYYIADIVRDETLQTLARQVAEWLLVHKKFADIDAIRELWLPHNQAYGSV